MPILAAGTALFAILAVVPTLAAAVAIYGLVADPLEIHSTCAASSRCCRVEVVEFIGDQLERQAKRSTASSVCSSAVSVVLAVFSARGSARALIDALNRAYRVRELRSGLVTSSRISLAMAIGTLIGLMLMFGVLVALPAIVARSTSSWIHARAMLAALAACCSAVVFVSLLALYRFAPSPRPLGTERHVWPGAAIATVLLVLVSFGLSQWVEHIATLRASSTARSAASIVDVLWFYLSTMALVIGGFVNAELERHSGAPAPNRSLY